MSFLAPAAARRTARLGLALLALSTSCGRSGVYDLPPAASDAGPPCSCGAQQHCQGGRCVCDDGYDLVGSSCVSIAASLSGLRWELPCVSLSHDDPELICFTTPDVTTAAVLGGSPQRRYQLRLRLRGVVETKQYTGGTTVADTIVRGGEPVTDAWNVYRLDVSAPRNSWFLNQGITGRYVCQRVDEELVLEAAGGATVTLFASAVDGALSEIRNVDAAGQPLVVPGVPPAPKSFDGQFLQMDVLSVQLLP